MRVDPFDAETVLGLSPNGPLAQFNRTGVLLAADVHVALALARLGNNATGGDTAGGRTDETVTLAAALAVRAPRAGHVLVDLASVRTTVVAGEGGEDDLVPLPWPDTDQWLEQLSKSALVTTGPDMPGERPLRLVGSALYLERYWRDEGRVCDDLLARSRSAPIKVDEVLLAHGLARLFPDDREGCQATAAARSLQRLLSVVAGGPGTGKTTTVARILALLEEQALAVGGPPLLVGLAAPTGKAAARMVEAVHNEANRLDVSASVRGRLLRTEASTVHRLLGRHPAGLNRFRHDARNQLPHDVVVVDETSMMSYQPP